MKKQIILLILTVVLVNCTLLQAQAIKPADADINKDGKINLLDLALLSKHWLSTIPDPNEFAYIPAGTFEMGDHFAEGDPDELPVHTVTLNSFYMSKYEITSLQYCDYLNSAQIKVDGGGVVYAADDTSNSYPYCDTSTSSPNSPINYSEGIFSVIIKDGTTDMSNHPMTRVSWYGCAAYCNWKSRQDGLESCYNLSTWQCDFNKNGYHLPTEANWEYAARGGKQNPYYRFPWGDSIDGSMMNYWSSGDPYETGAYPWTTPVGYYDGTQIPTGTDMANGYGLYDMAGNVWEWCNDWYDESYYSSSPTNNPTGPANRESRVHRGGSWPGESFLCMVARRGKDDPLDSYGRGGFRVCLSASH